MAVAPAAALSLLWFSTSFFAAAQGFGVFPVHRIADPVNMTRLEMRARDRIRHGRRLSPFEFELGGLGGRYLSTGIYYALINIGTPARTFRVQIDSGSDTLWINCEGCTKCPKKSGLGFTSTFYDEKASNTSQRVTCEDDMCSIINKGVAVEDICDSTSSSCSFSSSYADGSTAAGHLVKDSLQYVTAVGMGSNATKNESVPLVFGCSSAVDGSLAVDQYAVDGIIGFGRSNESFISQIGAQGKAKRVFGHCLDTKIGGGIFTVGEVVQPELKRTKMLVQYPGYRVSVKGITVGGKALDLPPEMFEDGVNKGAILDSGNSMSNFPQAAYDAIMEAIATVIKPPAPTEQGDVCFTADGKVDLDKILPNITLNFAGGAYVTLTPADYVTPAGMLRCVSFYPSSQETNDTKDMFVLGEVVMGNKVILYDLEKEEIGFSDHYNCSSFLKVKDDKTGNIIRLSAHELPSAANKVGRGMGALVVALSVLVYGFMAI